MEHTTLDAIAIGGAGARTLKLVDHLQQTFGIPVIGSDAELFWNIGCEPNIPFSAGCLVTNYCLSYQPLTRGHCPVTVSLSMRLK